jgi:hypothetical protein
MPWTILSALCAFRQFPYPVPDQPDPGPPSLFACICIAWMFVASVSFLLPRPWFVWLFECAFPWAPSRLEDWDDED